MLELEENPKTHLDLRVESTDIDDVRHVLSGQGKRLRVVVVVVRLEVRVHDFARPDVRDGHLVASESACLVGREEGDGSERLDSLEVLDEDVATGHPLGGDRKQELWEFCVSESAGRGEGRGGMYSNSSRESFGDERDENRDGKSNGGSRMALVNRGDSCTKSLTVSKPSSACLQKEKIPAHR